MTQEEIKDICLDNIKEGNIDEIKKLLEQGRLDTANIEFCLTSAVMTAPTDIAKLFLKYSPNFSSSPFASTALHFAIIRDTGMAEYLVEHGVDINGSYTESDDGKTMLMHAVQVGTTSTELIKNVRKMLEIGAEINLTDQFGETALMYALRREQYLDNFSEIVKLLLEHGATTNITARGGWTPLMFAFRRKDDENDLIKIINLLLEYGANVSSEELEDAFHFVRSRGYNEIYKLIKEARAKQKKEEENAFNAMIDIYFMHRSGEMSEDMLEKMNNLDKNWIEHCESELIKLGIEYYQIKNQNE